MIPDAMLAVYQTTPGAADEVLKVGDVPTPTPTGSQLLVKIAATSLNPVDFKVSETGMFKGEGRFILGWDASGTVVGLGADVKLHKVGDEVMFAGDVTRDGAHAQYAVVDERLVGRKPAQLSHTEAAVMPLTALTAWEGMIENMGIPMAGNSDRAILVVGAAGGLGSIVVQLAKKVLGLTVIGTASRDDSVAWAKDMGADFVINHRLNFKEQFEKQGLKPVDYVFNTASAVDNLEEIASVVAPLAKWVEINPPSKPLDLNPLFAKRVQLSFELMFSRSMFGVEPERQRAILNELADLLDRGVLKTTLTTPMDLFKDIKEAHKKSKSGTMIGKIGLTVAHGDDAASVAREE